VSRKPRRSHVPPHWPAPDDARKALDYDLPHGCVCPGHRLAATRLQPSDEVASPCGAFRSLTYVQSAAKSSGSRLASRAPRRSDG
jgi:hypothetical protein